MTDWRDAHKTNPSPNLALRRCCAVRLRASPSAQDDGREPCGVCGANRSEKSMVPLFILFFILVKANVRKDIVFFYGLCYNNTDV